MAYDRIKSRDFPEISVFETDSELGGLEIRKNPEEESGKDFFADNIKWVYALYKVLRKADQAGWFDSVKPEDGEEETTVFV